MDNQNNGFNNFNNYNNLPPVPPAPPTTPTAPGGTVAPGGPVGMTSAPVTPGARTHNRRSITPIVLTATLAALLASATSAAVTANLVKDNNASVSSDVSSSSIVTPIKSTTVSSDDWQAVSAQVAASVVAIEVETSEGSSQGSGVIIDSEGHILTNNHVVADANDNKVSVVLQDGRVFEAEITGLDETTDLAVIKLSSPPSDLSVATLGDSDQVSVGEGVLAIGNPLGLSNTVTSGIVSALDRPVTTGSTNDNSLIVTNAIQIDAAINPGNSGGPLFDADGNVIGITSSIATMSGDSSSSGSIGLGFAIPVNLANNIAQQLIEKGSAEHAFLGVSLSDGQGSSDGDNRQGAQVRQVTSDSPADGVLKEGDVIVSIDGKQVTGPESLTGYVRAKSVGQEVELGVIRDGELLSLKVTLDAKATTSSSDSSSSQNSQGSQGSQNDDDSAGSQLPYPGGQQYGQLPDLEEFFGSQLPNGRQ